MRKQAANAAGDGAGLLRNSLCLKVTQMVADRQLVPSVVDMRKVDYFIKFLATGQRGS